MTARRVISAALAALLACAPAVLPAQQRTGVISGQASGRFTPRGDYQVVLRDAVTGEQIATAPLAADGSFAFRSVTLQYRYLVELVQAKARRTVCTQGPIALTPAAQERTNVSIDCGKTPALLWMLAAAGGTAATVAGVTTASPSR